MSPEVSSQIDVKQTITNISQINVKIYRSFFSMGEGLVEEESV